MPDLNPRQASLVAAFQSRLETADAFTADNMLNEVEAANEYLDPSHNDHQAYISMVPLALGHRLKLSGHDPEMIGTGPDSSMLDNQRFSFDPYPKEPEADFSDEDNDYERSRDNAQKYLTQLQNGEVDGLHDEDMKTHIKAAQQTLIDIDTRYASVTQSRDTELERFDKQLDGWESEKSERAAQMKKDFMAVRMKNVLPDNREEYQALADTEWQRLSADYGF